MTNADMVALIKTADSTFKFITNLLSTRDVGLQILSAADAMPERQCATTKLRIAERALHPAQIEEELAVANPRNVQRNAGRRPRNARIIVAEAHPIGRTTLEKACRCVATDVHVVASWRKFAEVLDQLQSLSLTPDLIILGDAFANRDESEILARRYFPAARVVRLPTRSDGGLLAARALRRLEQLDQAA